MHRTNVYRSTSSASKTFATVPERMSASNYIENKRKRLLNCNPSCVPSTFDKSQLYVNLYTTMTLNSDIPVITDLSGGTFPVTIPTASSTPSYLTYVIDPSGILFGDTPCGINNYMNYVIP